MAKTKRKKDLITDEDMKPENVRWNISIRLPGDLLDAYKAEAGRLGIGYQTLMQIKLREAIEKPGIESRLEKIEKKLKMA